MTVAGAPRPHEPRRLGATDGRAHQVLGLALFVLGPVTTVVYGVAHGSRSATPFVATTTVQLAATAYLAWLARAWSRPQRRPGGVDLSLAVVPLVLAAVNLWLVQELARVYGIRDSAAFRLEQGIAFPADVGLAAAVVASAASLVAAVVLLVVLVRARRATTTAG